MLLVASCLDSRFTTMQVVIATTILETVDHVWRILTALTLASDRDSAFWNKMVFFPLTEGCYILPSAIVISVWMDVTNSSASRMKVTCHN